MGWVTVFGPAYHLDVYTNHPGQLNLLPSVEQEMSTGHGDALRLGDKDSMAHSICR